jgi:type 1 glutamine amidotransferase
MANTMNRRDFLKNSTAAGLAAAFAREVGATGSRSLPSQRRKVLFVYGGWPGHAPEACRDLFVPWMRQQGFEVVVAESLDVYTDAELMRSLDLVIQIWTMGTITHAQLQGLTAAVRGGTGMAGWHGGMCDAFRGQTEYQFMTGGQWVAHPGDITDYTVNITDPDDDVTRGLSDFTMYTEQYYMLVDPNNQVLATTTFSGNHLRWVEGCVVPVVWKKVYGKGRIFYSSLGHKIDDFEVPEVLEIQKRGILWAIESKYAETVKPIRPVYSKPA